VIFHRFFVCLSEGNTPTLCDLPRNGTLVCGDVGMDQVIIWGVFFCFGWVPAFSFPGLLLTPFMFSSNVIYLIPCIGPVHVKYHFMHFICICVHIWHVLSSILYYFFTFFPNVWPDFPAPGSFLLGVRSLTIRRLAYRGRPTALLMDGDGQGAREPLGALRNSGEWKKTYGIFMED